MNFDFLQFSIFEVFCKGNQIFQFLGQSEEPFDYKICYFFKKRASDIVLLTGAFRSFYFTETFESHKIP